MWFFWTTNVSLDSPQTLPIPLCSPCLDWVLPRLHVFLAGCLDVSRIRFGWWLLACLPSCQPHVTSTSSSRFERRRSQLQRIWVCLRRKYHTLNVFVEVGLHSWNQFKHACNLVVYHKSTFYALLSSPLFVHSFLLLFVCSPQQILHLQLIAPMIYLNIVSEILQSTS